MKSAGKARSNGLYRHIRTSKEIIRNLLNDLCKNKGNVVSSEELFHELWNEAYFCKSTNPIPVHISHIREKIRDSLENPRYIKTVWGVGYKIEE